VLVKLQGHSLKEASTVSGRSVSSLKLHVHRALKVASIRDVKSEGLFDPKACIGSWRTKRVTVEGRSYSLDDIENEVLRPLFKDPRVHYAINCASYGCPNLPRKAWSAATLEADLDAAARECINHPRAVTALPDNRIKVSSIYWWFSGDFGGREESTAACVAPAYLRKCARMAASLPTVAEDGYDWSLNDASIGAKLQ
jgi:hypothetical protein